MKKGQVCIKTAGRKAGKHCVIIETSNFPIVLYANGKKKKSNPLHLWFTNIEIDIKDEKKATEKLKELDLNG